MTVFEVGKTYFTHLITDSDHMVKITIAKRTAKRITTVEGKILGVKVWNDVEQVKPWGSYSMAPIVSADKEFV